MRYGAMPAVSELAAWRRRCGINEPNPAAAVGPYAMELTGDATGAAAAWTQLSCQYEAAIALCGEDPTGTTGAPSPSSRAST